MSDKAIEEIKRKFDLIFTQQEQPEDKERYGLLRAENDRVKMELESLRKRSKYWCETATDLRVRMKTIKSLLELEKDRLSKFDGGYYNILVALTRPDSVNTDCKQGANK